ncbi:unnamed protein product [Sympodiomycopsis kandeliae]
MTLTNGHLNGNSNGAASTSAMTPLKSRHTTSNTVSIIGCPFAAGQKKGGVDLGPEHIMNAGLAKQLTGLGWNVDFPGHQPLEQIAAQFQGNDPDVGVVKNSRAVSAVSKRVSDAVYDAQRRGNVALTLGGDHSIAMGTISGTLRAHPNAGVIYVDAHADINTPETTESGSLHGCPVSFLMGLPGTQISPFQEWMSANPLLRPDSLVYIGLRDVDEAEMKIFQDYNIKYFSMYHVDKYGIGKVVDMAMDFLNGGTANRNRPIHLTYDIDALDPTIAPSTGCFVPGGLTFREAHYICEAVYDSSSMVAMDLVEVNPALYDERDSAKTVAVACSLLRSAFGRNGAFRCQ